MAVTTRLATGNTITIRTESGVVFELLRTATGQGKRWTVIGSIGRQSITADAIVGMVFTPGGNPNWYAQGYAMIVQRGLNEHFGLHSAYGIAKPSPIIREVR